MSDYTPIEDFSVKDGLTTGDPDKLILGADIDAELAAIQTAVATKYDSGDLASQAQAEAGSNNTTLMTPLRVEQAIADYAASTTAAGIIEIATAAEVLAASSTSLAVTPGAMPVGSLAISAVADAAGTTIAGTTPTNIAGLDAIALAANQSYMFEIVLHINIATAADGFGVVWNHVAGALDTTDDFYSYEYLNFSGADHDFGGSNNMGSGVGFTFTPSAATSGVLRLQGYCKAGGSGCTLAIQAKKALDAGSDATVYGGSYAKFTLCDDPA